MIPHAQEHVNWREVFILFIYSFQIFLHFQALYTRDLPVECCNGIPLEPIPSRFQCCKPQRPRKWGSECVRELRRVGVAICPVTTPVSRGKWYLCNLSVLPLLFLPCLNYFVLKKRLWTIYQYNFSSISLFYSLNSVNIASKYCFYYSTTLLR